MKNYSKSESVFRKKGFYIALYSCIGVVLLLAAIISFYGLNTQDNKNVQQEDPNTYAQARQEPEISDALKSTLPEGRYLTPDDRAAKAATPGLAPKSTTAPAPTANPQASPSDASPEPAAATPAPAQPSASPLPGANTDSDSKAQLEENKTNQPEQKEQKDNQTSDVKNIEVATEKAAEPVFSEFSDGSVMQWPTFGEIIMDYSPEHVIYDVTLEQYRTNDSICIAAQLGAQVKASAEGVVKSVSSSKESGKTIVIDHGNGWETTYSQLQENILVAEGDVVKTGQVIGGVGSPSIYSVLLGNHLNFKVSKADEKVDPKSVLAE